MLSIHYVSIIMRFFYIDWQQHWECDRTMNIGANALGERTVSTKQPQVWQTWPPLTVGLPVTSERYWASFQVTRLDERYQQNSHKSDRLDLRWQLDFQWHRRGIELVFKSLDCFTKRLFHSGTIFLLLHMYLLFETSPGWLPGWRVFFVFFYLNLVGEHSAPMYLLFAPYTDL